MAVGRAPLPQDKEHSNTKGADMIRLSIPDINCNHCKATVEAALLPLAGPGNVIVDLSLREATVSGNAPAAALLAALHSAGYPARVTG